MPATVSSSETETRLRVALEAQGYALSPVRKDGENGVDIVATKETEVVHIEVIGYKKTGAARTKDFCESFFRVISRLKDGATKLVIACPVNFRDGMPARTAVYDRAWLRLGEAFPEVHIWFVYPDRLAFDRASWNTWYRTENRAHKLATGVMTE